MRLLVSWSEAGSEVDRMSSGNAEFGSRTIHNAKALISFLESRYPVANEVGSGYWPTINFSWLAPFSVTVEVFEDRYEFYRFFDKRTEIKHVEIGSDQSFQDALIHLLDGVLLDGGRSGPQT
jgi:CTP:phosphocholine cytidylyltransferase-like protein